ncbi:MAG: sigma-70 family RNA polymerase sigma factor, partial [Clostridia bacterium]|nr:sigma-70 family RNA polymerase sigma factor [Clostridia bacterium]
MFSVFSLFTYFFHVILGIGTPQNFPAPLSSEEEQSAFEVMASSQGQEAEDARQRLILHNLRLVSHIVRKYYSSSKNQEDLISIGTIGLCKAVDTFNVGNGTRFATYAAKCIQNEILMHFRSGKKLSAEISINETIDVDRDGNPLTYMDIICSDESVSDEVFTRI